MLVTKVTRGEVKVIDADEGLVSAVASTEAQDRDGDILRASGWNLDNFQKNPVLLSSHNYGSLKAAIGKWESLEVRGTKLVGTAKYFVNEGNEEADAGFKLAQKGMAAFSVGFVPDMEKAETLKNGKGYEFKGQELLEVSQVLIPSNPQAMQMARSLTNDPVMKQLIDEELSRGPTDDEGNPTYSQAAIKAGLREIVREILAEIGTESQAPSDSVPANAEGSTPAAPSILEILGVDE